MDDANDYGMMTTLGAAETDSPSVFSLEYYRRKAQEFQTMMNALDTTYWAASGALGTGALDEATAESLEGALADFESRRRMIKVTAEAINLGAASVNAMGGSFPRLNIPGTLGLPPIVAPAAMVAAIGTAAAIVVWGSQWISGVNERLRRAQIIESATPEQRARIVEAINNTDNAVTTAESSILASVAPIVKWAAIGLGAFLLYRAYKASRQG
jgi:hypothetical protein